MGWSRGEVSLTLVNDRAMAKLNRETFGRRGPTNVIAFPVDLEGEVWEGANEVRSVTNRERQDGPPPVLGEVVISLETTRRQAAQAGWPFEELLAFYLIHGLLHLVGYHHDTPAAEAAMEARTWELLKMLKEREGANRKQQG
ncbi:MAG: rRNA maturation RNase YbeY [Deltaproteobacteria bacterium]|nr:rRNA maturation RNase YbeY [Deltaproteobacteria bacterium]